MEAVYVMITNAVQNISDLLVYWRLTYISRLNGQWPVVFHNSEFHTPTGISRTTGTVQGYES